MCFCIIVNLFVSHSDGHSVKEPIAWLILMLPKKGAQKYFSVRRRCFFNFFHGSKWLLTLTKLPISVFSKHMLPFRFFHGSKWIAHIDIPINSRQCYCSHYICSKCFCFVYYSVGWQMIISFCFSITVRVIINFMLCGFVLLSICLSLIQTATQWKSPIAWLILMLPKKGA